MTFIRRLLEKEANVAGSFLEGNAWKDVVGRRVNGCDLKRECFVVLERGAAVEPEAGNVHHGKPNR